MRSIIHLFLGLLLGCFHFMWYSRVVAYKLWELSGGIQQHGVWTSYGQSDWAWTTPVYFPSGILFYMDWLTHPDHPNLALTFPAGMLLLVGSAVAGYALSSLLLAAIFRDRPMLGRWHWRFWFFLSGWLWIPVPSQISWIYQWTVVY